MLPEWFLWLQVITCGLAGVALLWNGHGWFAWTWFCYAAANIGWVYGTK